MDKKPYHHGNLKQELIEKGLEYVDRFGVESLSMRKLADSAGVSCAAPYAHFKSKDDFLDKVQDYITERLTEVLKETAAGCTDRLRILHELGKCYVLFFYENPLYYSFLFNRKKIDIYAYPPFQLFLSTAVETLRHLHGDSISEDDLRYKTIAMWSLVLGLPQIAMMEGIINTDSLDAEIDAVLGAVRI
ncbi:MAG: TetR/AcrR family transcriptional regulator [Lachnospiraceae bacterium]|nr:TetR/AcrR family transcriptional regulator [Lachnospiraceae bacterium]